MAGAKPANSAPRPDEGGGSNGAAPVNPSKGAPQGERGPGGDVNLESEARMRDFLASRHSSFEVFARTGGFIIQTTEGDTCFDHKRFAANIGTRQLAEVGLGFHGLEATIATERRVAHGVDNVTKHELGHLLQALSDPEAYKGFIDAGNRADGLGKHYFRFYNALLDVFVDQFTAFNDPVYRGRGREPGEIVKDLYHNVWFATQDLSKRPLSTQLTDYLLLGGMGVHGPYKFSEEIQEIAKRPVTLVGGRKCANLAEAAYHIMWGSALNVTTGAVDWKGLLARQRLMIDAALLPIFEGLVQKDLRKNPETFKREPGGGREGSIMVNDGNIGDIAQAVNERNATPKERQEKRGVNELARNVSPGDATEFMGLLKSLQPVSDQFYNIWKKLRKEIQEVKRTEVPRRRQGILDVEEFIDQYPAIQNGDRHPRVFIDTGVSVQKHYEPKKTELWVVLDLSGSMSSLEEKLRQLFVAAAASISRFNMESKNLHTEQSVALNIIGYSDTVVPLGRFERLEDIGEVIEPFTKIKANGGTCSHVALEQVRDEIAALRRQEQSQAKAAGGRGAKSSDAPIRILVELSDGDTIDVPRSTRAIEELKQMVDFAFGIRFEGNVASDSPPKPDEGKGLSEMIPRIDPAAEFRFDQQWGQNGIRVASVAKASVVMAAVIDTAVSRRGATVIRQGPMAPTGLNRSAARVRG